MAGAAAEQEERGHVDTRSGEETQEQTQDGHEGSSAHGRTAPRTPEGGPARHMQGEAEGESARTDSESDMDMDMQYDMAACEEEGEEDAPRSSTIDGRHGRRCSWEQSGDCCEGRVSVFEISRDETGIWTFSDYRRVVLGSGI